MHVKANQEVILNKYNSFGKVFALTWNKMFKKIPSIVPSAFRHCGLYPLQNPTVNSNFDLSVSYDQKNSAFETDVQQSSTQKRKISHENFN